jgi:hypothetical protein
MRIFLVRLVLCLFGATVQGQALAAARSCESLTSLSLPNTTITHARSVAEGGFPPPKPFIVPLPPDIWPRPLFLASFVRLQRLPYTRPEVFGESVVKCCQVRDTRTDLC